jgi:hypothetical protein
MHYAIPMLSLELAQKLKVAGLVWQPTLHDFFTIPDGDFDRRLFVLEDMLSTVEFRNGQMVLTFQGVVEWALDYVYLTEALWIPTESQLREQLESRLRVELPPYLMLVSTPDGYRCDIRVNGSWQGHEAFSASDAYAMALLTLLNG